jgi:hypothetical protein
MGILWWISITINQQLLNRHRFMEIIPLDDDTRIDKRVLGFFRNLAKNN